MIAVDRPLHGAIECAHDSPGIAASAGATVMAQQPAAHHRRQGQRHHRRGDHRDGQRQGEFAEHAADDAAHEQQRDEHRDQRYRQRDHGKADLLRAAQRRFEGILAFLHVAHDVLDHHDGVVDDEAGADRQRHQRQVIEAEAAEPHHPEGGDQRQRQRHPGDEGRPDGAQEHQHHQHHQADAQHQRELHVVHRSPDRPGAVLHHGERNAAWASSAAASAVRCRCGGPFRSRWRRAGAGYR